MTRDPLKHATASIGASLSDLVATVHGLVTEDETTPYLEQRLLELRGSVGAILLHAETIAKLRALKEVQQKPICMGCERPSHVGRCEPPTAPQERPEYGSCNHVQPGAPACTECLYGPIVKRRGTMEAYEPPKKPTCCRGIVGPDNCYVHTETCER